MNYDTYCSMIHGGLNLILENRKVLIQHCCLKNSSFEIDPATNFWSAKSLQPLRELNLTGKWSDTCQQICRVLENSGHTSFRVGMNSGLGIKGKTNISGPARIDLMFNRGCNLACRICDEASSTYWQKHLKENNLWFGDEIVDSEASDVIAALTNLDLSNLRMLVFCGGETLLGREYWKVAEWLADNVPDAKQNLTLCFQTNGTQTISPRNYSTIEKFFLVKLHVSLDGVGQQFDYMRWPASWQQVTENLFELRQNLPSNVMFLIEETLSIFNLATSYRLDQWAKENFSTNREGDIINHTKHLVYGVFGLHALSNEYVDALNQTFYSNLISSNFEENATAIHAALQEIKKFDRIRNEDFESVFPEVAAHYRRFR